MAAGSTRQRRPRRWGKYADTIVVGNAVYDLGAAVLKATVDAVQ